ncbi:MAG: hypothetical protein ACW98X_17845 [Promethearchaeota archaeon]|jgi:hypothetical protein
MGIQGKLIDLLTSEGWKRRGKTWSKIIEGIPHRFKMKQKTLRYEKQDPESKKWEHVASGYYGALDIVDGIIKGLQKPSELFGTLMNRFKKKE